MSKPVPEYSPRMLKAFLRAGATYRCFSAPLPAGRAATIARFKADIRKSARVTYAEIEFAWMGRLWTAAPRTKLWAALKINPADHGVKLVDGGSQEVISNG